MSPPDVSVVIPARNAQSTLHETLTSVQAQRHRPREIIVVDDRSTDATTEVARAAGARVVSGSGTGAAAALNAGIAQATSELIAHFDADDLMLPEKLAAQLALFADDRHCMVGLVTSDLQMFGPAGLDAQSFLENKPQFRQLFGTATAGPEPLRLTPQQSAAALCHEHCIDVKGVYRRSAWQRLGGFDIRYRCAYDMDFVWRLSRLYDVAIVPRVLFTGRRHAANLSGNATLVASECARLFRGMLGHPHAQQHRVVLRQRLYRELADLAYVYHRGGRWVRSMWQHLQMSLAKLSSHRTRDGWWGVAANPKEVNRP